MKDHESLIKSEEGAYTIQLQEKEAGVNHEKSALPSRAKRKEDVLLVTYKKKLLDIGHILKLEQVEQQLLQA
eukprot:1293653-Prorocentrum_lima.AAC.1